MKGPLSMMPFPVVLRRTLTSVAFLASISAAGLVRANEAVDWASMPPPAYIPEALRGSDKNSEPARQPVAPFTGFENAAVPASVTTDSIGKTVTVTGSVVSSRPSWSERAPTTLVLQQEPAVAVVYWQDIANVAEAGKGVPAKGTKISVRGKVQDWRGTLQIKPAHPDDLIIEGTHRNTKSATADTSAAVDKAMAAIPAGEGVIGAGHVLEHEGEAIVLVGKVAAMRDSWNERAPNILTLQDDTGSTEVVFWADTRKDLDESLLKPGTALVLGGIANQYRERPQVRLAGPDAIAAVNPASVTDQVETVHGIAKKAAAEYD